METRDRSIVPDSLWPGHGHPSDWISKPYSIVFTGGVLFILIFGIAVFLCYRQLEITRRNALVADKTTANLLAELIMEHNKATIGILQSYANRPLFIVAVKNKDLAGVHRHLSDLKKNANIDLTFVTDIQGILWANFPVFPEAIGKDLSYRGWYKGINSHWKPYISAVFKLIVGDKPLAVAVCVPIFDEKETVIGILVSSQRLGFLNGAIERVPFSPYTIVNVIDRGEILYSNRHSYGETITEYPHLLMLKQAMKDKRQQIEDTLHKDLGELYLSVVPVGDIGWTVVIERSLRDLYRSDLISFIEIGAVSFLLFLLIIFLLAYRRKVALFKKTEELLQAETKLRQGEEKLRALSLRQEAILASVPAIIMEVDNNKVYTWANSLGIDFFGEDVIGKEAAFYFEGEQDIYATVSPLFNGAERVIYVESWQRRKDGQKRLLAWWCRALKDEKGDVEGALSSAYDVTERKQEEDALIRSEQLLKDIQAISKVGGWEYDVEKKLLTWTDEVYRIYGVDRSYDPNDIGKAISFYSGEDQQIIEKAFLNAAHTGKPYDLELQFNAADGTRKWVRTIGKPVLEGDKIIKVFGNIVDITDRKQAEDKIRRQSQLLTAINSVLYETLMADKEEGVAKACLKVSQELTDSKFGFIGEITQEGLFTITALTDPGWEACHMPETQAGVLMKDMVIRGIWGQVIIKEQSLIVNDPMLYPDCVGIPEGHPPLSSFLGIPLKDQGKVIGMIALANRKSGYTSDHQQDMEALSIAFVEATRRRKAEEEIKKLNTELERRVIDRTAQLSAANKELEAFSYSVSHDLRAPLRSIDGFSQALLEEYQEKLDDTGKGYLERVRKATLRMGLLIDDMLKLSRINRAELKHETVDLSGVIRAIAKANQKYNPDRTVDVIIQEGIMVQGDPYLMQIALVNLLDNAWKFTANTRHPRIEFGTTVRNAEMACFIRDNGAGFDMAYVGKLFGAFQRLHTKEEFAGTGIGLATVQRIIHRHGGKVWAEGEKGKGATFYFTLP